MHIDANERINERATYQAREHRKQNNEIHNIPSINLLRFTPNLILRHSMHFQAFKRPNITNITRTWHKRTDIYIYIPSQCTRTILQCIGIISASGAYHQFNHHKLYHIFFYHLLHRLQSYSTMRAIKCRFMPLFRNKIFFFFASTTGNSKLKNVGTFYDHLR